MRSYSLHRKQHLHENKSKACPKCLRLPSGSFRCYVGYPSDPYDNGYPSEELGFSIGDDLGACSPRMVVLCAMIDEIMEVLKHSARNLDDTLSKYVLAQYEEEVKKTEASLLEEKEEAKAKKEAKQ